MRCYFITTVGALVRYQTSGFRKQNLWKKCHKTTEFLHFYGLHCGLYILPRIVIPVSPLYITMMADTNCVRVHIYGWTRIVYASKIMDTWVCDWRLFFFFRSDKNHADQYGFTGIFRHLGEFIHCYVMPDLDQMYVKSFFC